MGLMFLMGVQEEYNSLAGIYDRRWRHYVDVSAGRTLEALELRGDERVLDVGCGTGVLLDRLRRANPELSLHGVDPSDAMLAVAKERLGDTVRLKPGNAETLPFTDGEFGVVVSVSALHCFSDAGRAASEMARVLRPGGIAVITDWCADYWAMRLFAAWLRARKGALEELYGVPGISGLLETAGIAVSRVEQFRIRPLWGMMLVKGWKGA